MLPVHLRHPAEENVLPPPLCAGLVFARGTPSCYWQASPPHPERHPLLPTPAFHTTTYDHVPVRPGLPADHALAGTQPSRLPPLPLCSRRGVPARPQRRTRPPHASRPRLRRRGRCAWHRRLDERHGSRCCPSRSRAPRPHGPRRDPRGRCRSLRVDSLRLVWEPVDGGLFADGDHGFTTGTYTVRHLTDDSTERTVGQGSYLTLWRREADGAWKVVLDGGASGLPPDAASEERAAP